MWEAIAEIQANYGATLLNAVWPKNLATLPVIATCTSVVYLFLLFFMQYSRRGALGHSSMLDLVLMLVLANGVQNAMVAGDNSLVGGIVAALTLFAWEGILGLLRRRFPLLRPYIGGERIKILEDGQPVNERIRRHYNIGADDLEEAMEQQRIGTDELCDAYLEVDGSITLVPKARAKIKRRSQVALPHPRAPKR